MYCIYTYAHTQYMYIYICTFKKVHLASNAGPGDNPAKFSKQKTQRPSISTTLHNGFSEFVPQAADIPTCMRSSKNKTTFQNLYH